MSKVFVCDPSIPIPRRRELIVDPKWESLKTTKDVVKEMRVSEASTWPEYTVMEVMDQTVASFPDSTALSVLRAGRIISWSWKLYRETCYIVAGALVHLGLERHRTVVIAGCNCPEWCFAALGTMFAGGVSLGVHVVGNTVDWSDLFTKVNVQVVFVSTMVLLEQALTACKGMEKKTVKAIICWDPEFRPTASQEDSAEKDDPLVVMYFANLNHIGPGRKIGNPIYDEIVARQKEITPHHCCCVHLTSGTTGEPKAAMLSHDNITWTSANMGIMIGARHDEKIVSFLPLAHVAPSLVDIHGLMRFGGCAHFVEAIPTEMDKRLPPILEIIQPTIFAAVPRFWDQLKRVLETKAEIAESSFVSSMRSAAEHSWKRIEAGKSKTMKHRFGHYFVFKKIKKKMGLDKCRMFFSTASPLSSTTQEFFASIDIMVLDIFGLTEGSGPQTISSMEKGTGFRFGSCGRPLSGMDMKIVGGVGSGAVGEIRFRGRNVFMGYYGSPDETSEMFDDEGFVCSGDLGFIGEDGLVRLSKERVAYGRMGDIFTTQSGDIIHPSAIEDDIKREIPEIDHAVVVGGPEWPHLVVLLTIVRDENVLKARAQLLGSSEVDPSKIGEDPLWKNYVQKGIISVNASQKKMSNIIRNFLIFSSPFKVDSGELTPTLKLRRKWIIRKFRAEIDTLFQAGVDKK